MKKTTTLQKLKTDLVQDLKAALGDNLVSAVVHGAAARCRPDALSTPALVAIVLRNDDIEALTALGETEKQWTRRGIEFSFFFSQAYIEASRDVFALEYLLLKAHHIVLTGQDCFADIQISKADLRLQCERELRGRILHLRREIVRTRHQKRRLEDLVQRSMPDFLDIFAGILELADQLDSHLDPSQVVYRIENIFNTRYPAVKSLVNRDLPSRQHDLAELVGQYTREIDGILKHVDSGEFSPGLPPTTTKPNHQGVSK